MFRVVCFFLLSFFLVSAAQADIRLLEEKPAFCTAKTAEKKIEQILLKQHKDEFFNEVKLPVMKLATCVCESGPECTPPCLPDEKKLVRPCLCEPCPCRRCCGATRAPGEEKGYIEQLALMEKIEQGIVPRSRQPDVLEERVTIAPVYLQERL